MATRTVLALDLGNVSNVASSEGIGRAGEADEEYEPHREGEGLRIEHDSLLA